MPTQLPEGFFDTLKIDPKDASGDKGVQDAPPTWVADSPLVILTPSADGSECDVDHPGGSTPDGSTATVTVTVVSEGVPVSESKAYDLVGGQSTVLGLSSSGPQKRADVTPTPTP